MNVFIILNYDINRFKVWNQFNISAASGKIEKGEESNLDEMRPRREEERKREGGEERRAQLSSQSLIPSVNSFPS